MIHAAGIVGDVKGNIQLSALRQRDVESNAHLSIGGGDCVEKALNVVVAAWKGSALIIADAILSGR